MLLSTAILRAAPPVVEVIPSAQTSTEFSGWLRHNANAVAGHRAFIIREKIDKTPILVNDVLLLEKYSATAIVYEGKEITKPVVVGDYFTFLWDGKVSGQGKETCRIVGSITPDGIKTVAGTLIPFNNVSGIVRRILRITDGGVVTIPVLNVVIALK